MFAWVAGTSPAMTRCVTDKSHSSLGGQKALAVAGKQIVRPRPLRQFPRPPRIDSLSPRNKLTRGVKHMTVCIAALAADSKVIICITDKALTFSDKIQWDSDSSKITTFDNNKSLILIAGSEGPTNRVFRKINYLREEWSGSRIELMYALENGYKEAFSEQQEIELLHPELMTKDDYLRAISLPSINRYIEDLALRIQSFRQSFDCSILCCGFDRTQSPYIVLVEPPGTATDCSQTGFQAIGIGAEKATSGDSYLQNTND